MSFVLFADHSQEDLYPLTLTRPLFDLRCGIFTLREKWEKTIGHSVPFSAPLHLSAFHPKINHDPGSIWVNGKFYPDAELFRTIREATIPGTVLVNETGEVISFRFNHEAHTGFEGIISAEDLDKIKNSLTEYKIHTDKYPAIRFPQDLFRHNKDFIARDFAFLKDKPSGKITDTFSAIYGRDNLYIEEGVNVKASVINAEDGPVYLGKNVQLQEGTLLHGSHALLESVVTSMGAKLRGDSTFGPYCKMGGEIANSVVQGFSNKGHDGYMGNSVLGEWCNLGADTNTSNLKNNYTSVRIFNYKADRFIDTHSIFCGLIMGDHSKCGINTMFNTGTVAGVGCNIFGSGYPRNFIPDFSWGGKESITTYKPEKVFETEEIVMKRRGILLTDSHKELLKKIFEITGRNRSWESKN